MNAFIAAVICYVLAILFYNFKKVKMQLLFMGCGTALVIMIFICSSGKIDKIPFITATQNEVVKVDNSGIFYIASGASAQLGESFVMSNSQTQEDVANYLKNTSKNVYVHIKDGHDVIYTSNLGMLEAEDAERIMEMYETWKSDGTMPEDKVHYEFLCFYIDL